MVKDVKAQAKVGVKANDEKGKVVSTSSKGPQDMPVDPHDVDGDAPVTTMMHGDGGDADRSYPTSVGSGAAVVGHLHTSSKPSARAGDSDVSHTPAPTLPDSPKKQRKATLKRSNPSEHDAGSEASSWNMLHSSSSRPTFLQSGDSPGPLQEPAILQMPVVVEEEEAQTATQTQPFVAIFII